MRKANDKISFGIKRRKRNERMRSMKKKFLSPPKIFTGCLLLLFVVGMLILVQHRMTDSAIESTIKHNNENSIQGQRNKMEIEIMQAISDYDKDNIKDVSVCTEMSDNEIVFANIFVVSKVQITDVEEQNRIIDIASELFNLDRKNIEIQFTSSEVQNLY